MGKISPEFIKETQDFWEPRMGRRPTEAEAERMIRNVSNFFLLLMEWDAEEREALSQSSDKFLTQIQNQDERKVS